MTLNVDVEEEEEQSTEQQLFSKFNDNETFPKNLKPHINKDILRKFHQICNSIAKGWTSFEFQFKFSTV